MSKNRKQAVKVTKNGFSENREQRIFVETHNALTRGRSYKTARVLHREFFK